jgi:hypothetical protein
MRSGNVFVYAVTGNAHIEQVNRSLRFLKHFTRQQIVVLAARHDLPVDHDQVIEAQFPAELDDHQASILLKTGLHTRLDLANRTFCYIDSDVFAIHPDVGEIFHQKTGPVAFAADHSRLSNFSRFAVRCGCSGGCCDHLREAIAGKFGVEVTDPEWQHWNGGVFIFDAESVELLDTWHDYTRQILADPYWKTRDQGTLIATVWKFGLQDHPTLPPKFNYIVDAMRGLLDEERAAANPLTYKVDESYSLADGSPTHPAFLHFIGNTCRPGWRNWDEAEAKLNPVGELLSMTRSIT